MAFHRVDSHRNRHIESKSKSQKYILETEKWASVIGNSKQHTHIQLTVVGKIHSVSTLYRNSTHRRKGQSHFSVQALILGSIVTDVVGVAGKHG